MLINICYRTYSWFLSVYGLLTFKECVTGPWYKGCICFSHKTHRIRYNEKENFMLINIGIRTHNLYFKEWVTWPWCKGEFASHAKLIVTYAWILIPRPFKERLLTSCFQNLQKLNITLSNTDNFALQCFPFADFKFLNLTWDLKVGVPRIKNNRFQTSINDVEISHIYVHADEMVYSKLCHIIWKNPELYKCIVTLMGGFHQLRVKQRLIYKRSNCIGIKEWCINAGIIAPGSVA